MSVRVAVGSLTGASTRVKFSAPSLCRMRKRSSPPTTACSTEYSTSSRRGHTGTNSASASAASAYRISDVTALPAAMITYLSLRVRPTASQNRSSGS